MKFRDRRRLIFVLAGAWTLWILSDQGSGAQAAETGLAGIVYGQDQQGKHLGIVPGAKVELLNDAGKSVAAVEANQDGYYRITKLNPGKYRYKVSALGYAADDKGRGLAVPVEGAYAHHFVLTLHSTSAGKSNDPAAPPSQPVALSGRVWKQSPTGMQPIAGAVVALKNSAGGQVLVVGRVDAAREDADVPPARGGRGRG